MPDTPQEIRRVRLLISDTALDPDNRIFSDSEIQDFLDLEAGHVKPAAAAALLAIAVNEALVLKVITTRNLTTDGAKLAAELRAGAKDLRAQHVADLENDDDGYFEVVQFGGSHARPELTEHPLNGW